MKTVCSNFIKRHATLAGVVVVVLMACALGQSAIALSSSHSRLLPCGTQPVCKIGVHCSTGCACANIIRGQGMCVFP